MFKQKTAYELRISDWSSDGCSSDLFTLFGTPCVGLNGPPIFKHSEAFSFMVQTVTQEETDRLWNAIVDNGGQESVRSEERCVGYEWVRPCRSRWSRDR